MKLITALSFALLTAGAALSAEPASFRVTVTGQGKPMILIPGLACPGAVWDTTVARLQDTYECHVVSIAGFGGTPARTESGPLLEAVREELASYIRERHLERPVLVGHSLGGFLALDLAAKHPGLPGRLVIVDSLPFFLGVMRPGATAADAKQMAESTAAAFSQMDAKAYASMIRNGPNGSTMAAGETDLERIIAWGLASDPATVTQAMSEMYATDLREELARITVPTLTLAAWIGYAPYTNREIIGTTYRGQYARLEGVRIEITDTARHFIMLDEPDWMLARMKSFLEEAAPASR